MFNFKSSEEAVQFGKAHNTLLMVNKLYRAYFTIEKIFYNKFHKLPPDKLMRLAVKGQLCHEAAVAAENGLEKELNNENHD